MKCYLQAHGIMTKQLNVSQGHVHSVYITRAALCFKTNKTGVRQVCYLPVLLSVGIVRCSSVVSAGDRPSSASQPLHTHFPGA